MYRAPISPRNQAYGKHPQAGLGGISPLIALLYTLGGIVAVLALLDSGLLPVGQHAWALGLFAALQLVLMALGVPATSLGANIRGIVSFDRLVLVATILLFGPVPAAWAAGAVALIYTLARNVQDERWQALLLRAFGNGGMYLLATLAAGYAWLAVGGSAPVDEFGLLNIGRIAILIVTLGVTNEVLYTALTWPARSKKKKQRLVHWPVLGLEFILAWTGVAAARTFITLTSAAFALYILLILVIAVMLRFSLYALERERGQTRELAAVNRVNQAAAATTNPDELIETIFCEMQTLMQFSAFIFGLCAPGNDEVDIRLNYDRGTRHPVGARKLGAGITGWVVQHKEAVLITDSRESDHPSLHGRGTHGRPAISFATVPIEFQGEIVGVMSVQDYRRNAFGPHQLRLLQSFADQVATAIANTRLFAELQGYQLELEERVARRTRELENAHTALSRAIEGKEELLRQLEEENRYDALTGLANRRHLESILRQEHYRSRRFGHPLALIIADIDRFKHINDTWGHLLGDEVLARIANLLREGLRATDLVARYGGEEFVVLLPETEGATAAETCERLRASVAEHAWHELDKDLTVTMSFGVCDNQQDTYTEMLKRADEAMYLAKLNGRDRVCDCKDLEAV
jgi:diguanylate cyclase (GGDEF)-like protein